MMDLTKISIDPYARLYFFDRSPLEGASPDWLRWYEVFESATQGNFSRTPELVEICHNTRNNLLQRACSYLLGDAGSSEALITVQEYVVRHLSYQDPLDTDIALGMLNALLQRGWLADVDLMLRAYEFIVSAPDARIVALFLSWMLEPQWGPIGVAPRDEEGFVDYRALVMARVEELRDAVGSDRVPIFLGEVLHVPKLARASLERLDKTHDALQPRIRRRLEASTGVDCSSFFENGGFRPLRAAVMLESMLESGALDRYIPGQRYFFGFPVP